MLSKKVLAALAVVFSVSVVACAAPANDGASSAAELSTREDLLGSYQGRDSFQSLVLSSRQIGEGSEFTAKVVTGIQCITIPCPSMERIVGTYVIDGDSITLASDTASKFVQPFLGTYSFSVDGETLTLSRNDMTLSLTKE